MFFRTLFSIVLAIALLTGCASPNADLDRQFIDMMVPHHQGAVEMARIAQSRAEHQEIKQMAASIMQGQNAEIDQMKAWRKAWFGSDQTPGMDKMPMMPGTTMDHSNMPGMSSGSTIMNMTADVERLKVSPDPFDQMFIDMMIPHHQSAIDAANVIQAKTQRQELKTLASAIISDQQREIDQMKQWRQAWFGGSTPGR